MTARWRIPPDHWWGYWSARRSGVGNPDRLEGLDDPAPDLLPGGLAVVVLDGVADLLADPLHGVQGGHRVLEDHADPLAADRPHLALRQPEDVGAVEEDLPAGDASVGGQQPHQGEHRDGLARAGLADDPERLARLERERQVTDGVHRPVEGVELDAEVADLEEAHRLAFGSRASRIPSPMKMTDTEVRMIARPGGQPEPGHRRDDGERLRALEHVAPGRLRRDDAEAEEGQRRLGEDGGRDEQRAADGDLRDHRGQQVAAHDRRSARPGRRSGLDEVQLAHAEHHRARDPGRGGPRERRDEHDEEGDRRAEDASADDDDEERRHRHEDVGDPHQRRVDAASGAAGDDPDDGPERQGRRRRREADEDRHPPTREQPGEHVAAEQVGAEDVPVPWRLPAGGEVLGVRVDPEEVRARRPTARMMRTRATTETARAEVGPEPAQRQWDGLRGVRIVSPDDGRPFGRDCRAETSARAARAALSALSAPENAGFAHCSLTLGSSTETRMSAAKLFSTTSRATIMPKSEVVG